MEKKNVRVGQYVDIVNDRLYVRWVATNAVSYKWSGWDDWDVRTMDSFTDMLQRWDCKYVGFTEYVKLLK